MNEIVTVLGHNIRKFRKEIGWTQEHLAEKAQISVPFMTQIELGRKSASLEVIENISKSLGVPYDILFKKDTDDVSCSKHEIHILEKEIVKEVTKTIHEVFEKK